MVKKEVEMFDVRRTEEFKAGVVTYLAGGRSGNKGAVPAGDATDQPQALSDVRLRVQ